MREVVGDRTVVSNPRLLCPRPARSTSEVGMLVIAMPLRGRG